MHTPAKTNDFFWAYLLNYSDYEPQSLGLFRGHYFTVTSEVNINLEVYEDSFEIRYKIKRTFYILIHLYLVDLMPGLLSFPKRKQAVNKLTVDNIKIIH